MGVCQLMPIIINMAKAREIKLDYIRAARNVRLAALDVPFMKAVESGDTESISRISSEKQILRDIPQTFLLDDYNDIDTLKSVWPKEL